MEGQKLLFDVGPSKEKEPRQKEPTQNEKDFEKWWQLVPRKVGKKKARAAFLRERASVVQERGITLAAAADYLCEGMAAYAASPKVREGTYVMHPTTWLNGGHYDDDPREWETDESRAARARQRRGNEAQRKQHTQQADRAKEQRDEKELNEQLEKDYGPLLDDHTRGEKRKLALEAGGPGLVRLLSGDPDSPMVRGMLLKYLFEQATE